MITATLSYSFFQLNVLVDSSERARLADFQLANFVDADVSAGTTTVSAARYTAPEILRSRLVQPTEAPNNDPVATEYTPASDMFSFGQVAWHVRPLVRTDRQASQTDILFPPDLHRGDPVRGAGRPTCWSADIIGAISGIPLFVWIHAEIALGDYGSMLG